MESIVSDTVSATSQNSILKSNKKESSLKNCQISTAPVVSNLSEKSVLGRTRGSNAVPDVHNNVKHLEGT